MKGLSAVILAATTMATIAVMWVQAKWPTSVPEVAMCLLGAVWGLWFAARKSEMRWVWVCIPLACVAGLGLVQVAAGTTVYAWQTRMAIVYWTGNFATFFIAMQIFASRDWRVRYMDWLLIFGVFVSISSTALYMTSGSTWVSQRLTPEAVIRDPIFGPFLYVNQYAAFIELMLPLAIYGALYRERGRFLCIAAASIMFGSVIYSGSRGGSALVMFEMILVPLCMAGRRGITRRQLMDTGVILIVSGFCVVVAVGPDSLINRLSGKQDLFAARREFNQSSLLMIRARPLQGFGLGNWATAYPGYASFDDGRRANQAHNDWLQWTVEGGIPLLLIMLSIAVWAIPRAIRSGWGFGVAAIFVHCLWDYPIQRTGVAIVFFTMMAAIAPYGRPDKKTRVMDEPALE